jgi:hypothetical protein
LRKLVVFAALALAVVSTPAAESQEVVRVAYYYKVRWGFQEEFERLFFKNHRPILAAQTKSDGRIRDVSFYRPQFHGDGRGDWTFLVVITFANWAALKSTVDEAEIAKGIFPDLEAWRREEKRRFEIIDAHWDVPLVPVQPPK